MAARRKFKWDFHAYGDPVKNAIIRSAHKYGANLKYGDIAYLLFKSEKLNKTTLDRVQFLRRTLTGFYALIDTDYGDKRCVFYSYFKGYMIYENECDAVAHRLVHTAHITAMRKAEAAEWEKELEEVITYARNNDSLK